MKDGQQILEAGLMVLGMYFVVQGGVSFVSAAVGMLAGLPKLGLAALVVVLMRFLSPALYLMAAMMLLRQTRSCARWCLRGGGDSFSA